MSRFGAGRVMSHTEIAALVLPVASASRGCRPIGASSACSIAAIGSAAAAADFASSTRYRNPSGSSAANVPLPNAKLTLILNPSSVDRAP